MRYRADIDGLRTLAVFAVVLAHLGVPGFGGGFVGVDIFFVISGFLITGYLIDRATVNDGKISLREFYFRRARRILPMALAVLIATTVAAWMLFNEVKAGQVATDSYWASLFLANLHLIQLSTDYFNQAFAASPVQHYWSLAVEEQFYLFFPLILIAAIWVSKRMNRQWLKPVTAVVAAGSVASLVWAIAQGSGVSASAYFSSGTRAYELGIGALLALGLAVSRRSLSPRLATPLGAVGLILMGGSIALLSSAVSFPSFWALLPTLGAGLFILAGGTQENEPQPLINRGFSLKPIVYLGKISFSIYLIHWPLLTFWSQLDPGNEFLVVGSGKPRHHGGALSANLPIR
jgi:peptidoglycan/LPS O-acetylase OafA/YrhL